MTRQCSACHEAHIWHKPEHARRTQISRVFCSFLTYMSAQCTSIQKFRISSWHKPPHPLPLPTIFTSTIVVSEVWVKDMLQPCSTRHPPDFEVAAGCQNCCTCSSFAGVGASAFSCTETYCGSRKLSLASCLTCSRST